MTQKKIKQEQEKIKWVLMKSLGKKYINNNKKRNFNRNVDKKTGESDRVKKERKRKNNEGRHEKRTKYKIKEQRVSKKRRLEIYYASV